MSDDRLERIESKLDKLTTTVEGLGATVGQLDSKVGALDSKVGALDSRVGALETTTTGLKAGQDTLSGQVSDLRAHMGVLHEEVLDRLRAAAEDDSLRIEMNRRFDEVVESLKDHAIPGNAADRYFARKINEHDRRLDDLERRP